MDTAEVEEALGELEMRVERLRALYEQYFMGIEKLEPTVLRKDVDRRFWHLRREQIRNTALRFRLNTINQRYNTYQQYWQRICREIENGTYMRHLRRAERRFGTELLTIATRKRGRRAPQQEQDRKQQGAQQAEPALQQDPALDELDVDVDFELDGDVPDAPATHTPQQSHARQLPALDDLDDLNSVMGLKDVRNPLAPRPMAAPADARLKPTLDRLDSPESFMGPREPAVRTPARLDPTPTRGDALDIFSEDDSDQTRPYRSPFERESVRPPAPPRSTVSALLSRPPGALQPGPVAGPGPATVAPGLPLQPPQPPGARPAAPGDVPPTPAQRPDAGKASAAVAATPPRAVASTLAGSPRPSRETPAHQPTRPVACGGLDEALSESRVRQIYQEYVRAKRQCNEPTSSITEDGLASTLRKSAEQLRAKHRGRKVDFAVVIKGGRAVLKPVVKG
ncbi:MAG: hypothetical protein MUF54_07860 [Polyangiaceae bacterium]|nr:hypothetical protein [Polyangiaceae bacterium]